MNFAKHNLERVQEETVRNMTAAQRVLRAKIKRDEHEKQAQKILSKPFKGKK